MTWFEIFKKEFIDIFRKDPRRCIFILGAPLAYLFIFGLLYSPQIVNNIPIAICDEDQTVLSRQITQALSDTERLKVISINNNNEDSKLLLEKEIVAATIYIPSNFSTQIKTGQNSKIMFTIDGSNLVTTNTLITTIQPIIGSITKQVSINILNAKFPTKINSSGKIAPINAEYRVLHNPTENYIYFFLLGLAMAAFQQGIFLSTGAGLLSKPLTITNNSYQHLLSYFSAKITPYVILSIISFILTTYSAIAFFNLPYIFSYPQLSLLTISFILAAVAFTLFIASFVKSELSFTRISVIYTVPAFVLSGFTWPYQAMDFGGKFLSHLFPLSYFANTYREIILSGNSPTLFTDSFTLMFIATILFIISIIRYNKFYFEKNV